MTGTHNQPWDNFGTSVIGPQHLKLRTPNQDSWMARKFKWGNVVVVSDGLGSKKHSDHGSKVACRAVIESAKVYQKNSDAKFSDILRLIHAYWLVNTAPFSPSDCCATCLFVIQINDTITLGRLGDGMITALMQNSKNHIVLYDNKQDSFSNYTNCLQQEFRVDQWEIKTIESKVCQGVVLCTDGISDDLLPEKQMDFCQTLYSTYSNMPTEKRNIDLRRWLTNWPVPHHSDDKTIACLFKKEIGNEPKY